MSEEPHQISLAVKEHRFVFRYPKGQEIHLVEAMTDLASTKKWSQFGFDWYAAAVLSYKIGQKQMSDLT